MTQPKTAESAQLEIAFDKLAKQIHKDTRFSSRISDRVEHPAYREVIKMGESVIPLIFRYMEDGNGGFWFAALEALTGADPTLPPRPVAPGFVALDIKGMEEAWLKWGKEQGYCW